MPNAQSNGIFYCLFKLAQEKKWLGELGPSIHWIGPNHRIGPEIGHLAVFLTFLKLLSCLQSMYMIIIVMSGSWDWAF